MSTRDKILDAAAAVIGELGLARATTKEIARAAGYSEATLYKHFDTKTDLFTAVLAERSPSGMAEALRGLGEIDDIRLALEHLAGAAIEFYRLGFPMAASLFAEPELLRAHRADLAARGVGPHLAAKAVSGYLSAAQDSGTVSREIDPYAAASLLLGACLQRAFLSHFTEVDARDDAAFAAGIVDTLLRGAAG